MAASWEGSTDHNFWYTDFNEIKVSQIANVWRLIRNSSFVSMETLASRVESSEKCRFGLIIQNLWFNTSYLPPELAKLFQSQSYFRVYLLNSQKFSIQFFWQYYLMFHYTGWVKKVLLFIKRKRKVDYRNRQLRKRWWTRCRLTFI